MKSIFASKTFWVNLISAIATILEGQQVIDVIPDQYHALVAALVFALNIALRYITTQPVNVSLPGASKVILIGAIGLTTLACGSKMGNIQTPEGRQAFYQNEVLLRIERLQTAAISANAKSALPDAIAIPIVRFTVASAKTIRDVPSGWLATVQTAWTQTKAAIPLPIQTQYETYIVAIDAILATVTTGKDQPPADLVPLMEGVR